MSITGTAEANSTVELFIGGSSIGTTTANGSGAWTYDHTGTTLAEGSYSVTADATDLAGNTGSASSALPVRIDITAPNTPVISAITTDSGSSSTDEITNDQTLEFSGTAEANSMVTVLDGATTLGTTNTNGTGAWTFDYTGTSLSEGTHSITATATDSAGNVSSATSTFTVVIDITAPNAPDVASISTDSGSSSTDELTNDQTLVFAGTAEANSTVESIYWRNKLRYNFSQWFWCMDI